MCYQNIKFHENGCDEEIYVNFKPENTGLLDLAILRHGRDDVQNNPKSRASLEEIIELLERRDGVRAENLK